MGAYPKYIYEKIKHVATKYINCSYIVSRQAKIAVHIFRGICGKHIKKNKWFSWNQADPWCGWDKERNLGKVLRAFLAEWWIYGVFL